LAAGAGHRHRRARGSEKLQQALKQPFIIEQPRRPAGGSIGTDGR